MARKGDLMKNAVGTIVVLIIAIGFCFSSYLAEAGNVAKAKEVIIGEKGENALDDVTVYDCDVKFFTLKTKIDISLNTETVYTVEGKVVRIITDPLQLVNADGNVVAEASDKFNLVSEDDHMITVGSEEIEMKGNFTLVGKQYTLFVAGEKVGDFSIDTNGMLGSIRDISGSIVAEYKIKNPLLADYTLSIYQNNIFSDEAINMVVASYYSDLAWERRQNLSE